MAKIKFTAQTIKALKPAARSIEYYDTQRQRGEGAFGIRVSPKGRKTWVVAYKSPIDRKVKRISLGTYPTLSLANARKKANAIMAQVNTGEDPQAEKQAYKVAETFSDLWESYISSDRFKRKANQTEEIRKYNRHLHDSLGPMKVIDIKRKHIAAITHELAKTAPVSANRLHALLSIVFRHAFNLGLIDTHPMYGMDKPGGKESSRKRVLSLDEIKLIWPHLTGPVGDIYKLILLTAQRPGEVMAMHRDEIQDRIWTIRHTKTGVPSIVPLSPPVVAIIQDREVSYSGYIFPSPTEIGHIRYISKYRYRLQEKEELRYLEPWTAHDFRRTAATLLAEHCGASAEIVDRILNHSLGKISETYNKALLLDEKRTALEKLAELIS